MEDGITRLSGADLVSISTDDAPEGEVAKINAELLDGRPSSDYVLKTDGMVVTKNYSVVGGIDKPTIPTENMIWIQTENTIGKVHFSSVEPSSVNDNDIWIYTSNSSSVAFDAIKIGYDTMNTVYPLSAKQYVSGAWVDKTAKSYQNGKWGEWKVSILTLFKEFKEMRQNGTGGITVNNGVINCSTTSSASNAQGNVCYYSDAKVDVSEYKTLTFKATVSGNNNYSAVNFYSTNTGVIGWENIVAGVVLESGTKTYTIDISSVGNNAYFGIGLNAGTNVYRLDVEISDLYLT